MASSIIKNAGLTEYFHNVMRSTPGLHACVLFDAEGVQLMRVENKEGAPALFNSECEAALAETFALAMDQASKLSLGGGKSLLAFYSEVTLVHLNFSPLVLSFIGSQDVNCGVVLELASELKRIMQPIRKAIADSDMN